MSQENSLSYPATPPEDAPFVTAATRQTGMVTGGEPTYASSGWADADPEVSVVVTTFGRSGFLRDLVDAFRRQTLDRRRFEVVVVDNGSDDGTWSVLGELATTTELAVLAVRLPMNRGAAAGRNAGLRRCRGSVVAFTDDDCVPTAGWLAALVAPFASGAGVVQGLTEPDPAAPPWPQPWARTVWIREPSWLFETCNIAYDRQVLADTGGFAEDDALTARAGGRAFGEDVVLGWRAIEGGACFEFAAGAVVHHRWMPGSYRRWLTELRQLRDFPPLVRRCPGMARAFWKGPFLSRRTAAFDLAVVAGLVMAAGPRRLRWVAPAGVVPWLVGALPRARARPGQPVPVRLAQVAGADAVVFASLVEGSVRATRAVL